MYPKYSLVVPIYNEQETLLQMYWRLSAVMATLDAPAELIFVNDGSKDLSAQIIYDLHEKDTRVCYINLARNFGHQIAVTAGLNFARGQAVIVLDGDLQDPPELIPKMIARWQQGDRVVYAQRRQRHQENWFKRSCAYLFYRVLNFLADINIPNDTGDFCLMDRKVVDLLNSMPERNRYIRGLRAWVGFRQSSIIFDREPRFAGNVKYTFYKSLKLAIDSLVSFSRVPLRLATYLGLLSAVLAIFMAFLVLYWRLLQANSPVTGFATILTVVFFLGAVQLVSIGILGEYIGRIYEEVKGRPLYTLSDIGGFHQPIYAQKTYGEGNDYH